MCIDNHIHVAAGERLRPGAVLEKFIARIFLWHRVLCGQGSRQVVFSNRRNRMMIPNCGVDVHRLAKKRHWLPQKRSLANHEKEYTSFLRQINHHKSLSVW